MQMLIVLMAVLAFVFFAKVIPKKAGASTASVLSPAAGPATGGAGGVFSAGSPQLTNTAIPGDEPGVQTPIREQVSLPVVSPAIASLQDTSFRAAIIEAVKSGGFFAANPTLKDLTLWNPAGAAPEPAATTDYVAEAVEQLTVITPPTEPVSIEAQSSPFIEDFLEANRLDTRLYADLSTYKYRQIYGEGNLL